MILKYDLPTIVYPSQTDSSGRLGISDCFSLFMDIAAPHAALLDCGTQDLAKKNLFWLTVRSKIKIIRRPYMMENITLSTWPDDPEETRCNRNYSITQNGKPLVLGKTLWAVLNIKTGKLSRVDELYPEGFKAHQEITIPEPFTRFNRSFEGEPFGSYQVRSTDIDFGGHMNNIAYIRALESLFTAKEWQELNVTEAEIHYKSPCFEGNILNFEKKTVDDSVQFCAKLPDGKIVLNAALKTSNPV
ncbi:MAG: hypothetical protein IKF90_09270 [Parasporobacterium sp.]|nr:hypothetical protein [Parasporobacterium sp.]